jgi:hypothetical protein
LVTFLLLIAQHGPYVGLPVCSLDLVAQVLDHFACNGSAQLGVSLLEPSQRQQLMRIARIVPDDRDGLAAMFSECEDEAGHARPLAPQE